MSAADRYDVVPIKDYVDAQVRFALRLLDTIDQKNTAFAAMVDTKNSLAIDRALASEQLARTVALAEIKGVMNFHNDVVRGGERAVAKLTAEMITRAEFKHVADFVERARQSAITTGKFVAGMFATAGLCLTFGFGFANYLQSARTAAIRANESSTSSRESPASSPRVVIPLPPAQMDER